MSDKTPLTPRQSAIIRFAKTHSWFSASDVATIATNTSPATLRRDLSTLAGMGLLEKKGENKGVKYALTEKNHLFLPYELGEYYRQDEDTRNARESYNFSLFPTLSEAPSLFNPEQLQRMEEASRVFRSNAHDMSPSLRRRELERFVIEFSWKSSKIEGNTYSLIDTEFLLRNGIEAEGKSKYEAKMILNHKKAYLFAVESMRENVPINTAYIEQLHRYVTDGLGVEHGVRDRIVGITGSRYTPLAMKQQLKEQLIALSEVIASRKSPYEQALVAVLGLSYLQPFEDGNKRTARVLANSLLLRHNYAPLSYRSVDEREYKEATLIFYEQNSIQPFRELFVEQYVYSATHYNIAL